MSNITLTWELYDMLEDLSAKTGESDKEIIIRLVRAEHKKRWKKYKREEKMSKHTPAPWWIDDENYISARDDEGDFTVAEPMIHCQWNEITQQHEDCVEERDANARLIAAAPDLLEVAKCALADLEGMQNQMDPSDPAVQTIHDLQKAIEKAEGGTGMITPGGSKKPGSEIAQCQFCKKGPGRKGIVRFLNGFICYNCFLMLAAEVPQAKRRFEKES